MAAPAFGFSIGDFIAGARILAQVIDAFKNVGGASSKHAAQVSFLHSFKATVEHLERHVRDTAQSNLATEISRLLSDISGPWTEFKNFLDKHERALGQIANKPARASVRRIPRVVQFTMHEISGKVEKLRLEIQQPLAAVKSLLILHVINALEKRPEQKLRPEQCAQLVEAIKLADIPTELGKQIRVLKRTADEHDLKHDEQLEIIKTLRNQLSDLTSTLQNVLDSLRKDKAADLHRDVRQDVGRLAILLANRAESLETAMKGQEQTIQELKSFVEERSLTPNHENGQGTVSSISWPSATLSAAYYAALLLSTVVTTCTANAVLNRELRHHTTIRAQAARSPMFLPKNYGLPGLRAFDSQFTPPAPSIDTATGREAALAAECRLNKAKQSTSSEWVSSFKAQTHVNRTRTGGVVGEGMLSMEDIDNDEPILAKLDEPRNSDSDYDNGNPGVEPFLGSGSSPGYDAEDNVWREDPEDCADNIWDKSSFPDPSSSDSGISWDSD